jgi:hypothetical protein
MKKLTTAKSQVKIVQSSNSCYIYGILDLGQKVVLDAKSIGTGNSKIYNIPYSDISALVSRSPYVQYDPSEKNLLIHNSALQEARVKFNCGVLPLRFSTVAKSESDVLKILANGYSKFKQKLNEIGDMLEVAVKVYCNIGALKDNVNSEKDPTEAMKKKSYDLANNLLQKLKPFSVKHLLNDLIFDDMVMNAAFLIKEESAKPLLGALKEYDRANDEFLKIQISGPYVPYSFANPE